MSGSAVPATRVFIHGWASSSGIWDPVIERIDGACMTMDLPGYTAEGIPGPVDLPDPCVLIGWSLGGLQAITLAACLGSRVKALVLVAASPCFVQRADWAQAMPAAVFDRFARDLERDREACLQHFMALQCLGDIHAVAVRNGLRAARPEPLPGGRILAQGLAQLADQDLRRELAGLPCPVHVILGERDSLIPAAQAGALEALGKGIRTTVMPGAAHLPFLSDSRGFVERLAQGPAGDV